MAVYRAYCFDGAGKISLADWIDAKTDDEALAAARAMGGEGKCELWDRDRLVGTIKIGHRRSDLQSRID